MMPIGKYPPLFYNNSKGLKILADAWEGMDRENKRMVIVAALKLVERLRKEQASSSSLDIDSISIQ